MVLTVVQLIAGYAFLKRLDDFLQVQPQLVQLASPPGVTELVAAPVFATAALMLLFATPLLGMRSIAEERRNQTMVFLTSAPLSMTQIVLGKFLGIWIFLALIVALVAVMPLSLAASTSLDYGLLASRVLWSAPAFRGLCSDQSVHLFAHGAARGGRVRQPSPRSPA